MAFKKIESSSSGSLPFFKEWLLEQDKDYCEFLSEKLVKPILIKAVQSGKGYLINFGHSFMIFIWKNSSIGKLIKKMLIEETGELLLLQFTKTKKGLDYEIGFDDEKEVTVTEEKYEEGTYYLEETTEPSPIAPNENRSSLIELPIQSPRTPIKFTTTSKPTDKTKTRSNGEDAK